MENMLKIYIMGCAAVVESSVNLEDWQLVERYIPDALRIVNEDGEEVFRVSTDEGPGRINDENVVWGEAVSETGKATITVLIDPAEKDKIGAVREVTDAALSSLERIERMMPDITEKIREKTRKTDGRMIIKI